jgi:uncharacterized protein YbaA (DUF1428 family)
MSYVDGFLIPVPKKSVAAYGKIAKLAAKVWREHGALDYKECVGDDLNMKFGVPFTKLAKAKPNETIIFAYIVYKSRAHRDRVNAKVMKDPRMDMDPSSMPFDIKRMSVGGFKTIVEW